MPFEFRRAYRLRFPQNYLAGVAMVAVGVRVREGSRIRGRTGNGGPPTGRGVEITFLLNDINCGHEIHGQVIYDDGNAIVVEDHHRRGSDARPVHWTFEPLTRDHVLDMDDLQGRMEIISECRTDAAIQRFFVDEFLHDDWWNEFAADEETVRGADRRERR